MSQFYSNPGVDFSQYQPMKNMADMLNVQQLFENNRIKAMERRLLEQQLDTKSQFDKGVAEGMIDPFAVQQQAPQQQPQQQPAPNIPLGQMGSKSAMSPMMQRPQAPQGTPDLMNQVMAQRAQATQGQQPQQTQSPGGGTPDTSKLGSMYLESLKQVYKKAINKGFGPNSPQVAKMALNEIEKVQAQQAATQSAWLTGAGAYQKAYRQAGMSGREMLAQNAPQYAKMDTSGSGDLTPLYGADGKTVVAYRDEQTGKTVKADKPERATSEQEKEKMQSLEKKKILGQPLSPDEDADLKAWKSLNKNDKGDDFSTWTPEAKNNAYMLNMITNKPPVIAQGFGGNERKAYGKGYGQWQVDKGFSAQDIALIQADYRAGDTSLKNMTKQEYPMLAFVSNINKQIDKVQELYTNNDRVGLRLIDKPVRDLKVLAKGSGDEAVKASYLLEISNEIGKLSSGASGSVQQLSDSAKEDWKKVHDPNLSLTEIMKVVHATRDQANMRMDSWKEAKEAVRTEIGMLGTASSGTVPKENHSAAATPSLEEFLSKAMVRNPKATRQRLTEYYNQKYGGR